MSGPRSSHFGASYLRMCRYDSEVTNEDEDEEPMAYYRSRQSIMNSDSDDEDEDDVLEMRTASSRSRTSSSLGSLPSKLILAPDAAHTPHPHLHPPLVRRASTGPEHVSIAPIAPTLLKGTGVGNNLASPGLPAPAPKEVELVYAPPRNSDYSAGRSTGRHLSEEAAVTCCRVRFRAATQGCNACRPWIRGTLW